MATSKYYRDMMNRAAFDIFFPSKRGKQKQNDTIVIVGRKGSGKTSVLLYLIKLYLKFTHKRDKDEDEDDDKKLVYIFTQVPENFEKLKSKYEDEVDTVDVSKILNDEEFDGKNYILPNLSEISDSLVVFDDTENIPVRSINQQMTKFINLCFQNGRNYNLTVILVLHHLNPGRERTQLIKEADSIIMFPGNMDNNLLKTLINHYGFSKDAAIDLFRLPEKFIFLRNTEPSYIFGSTSQRIMDVKRWY
jgi:Cdc6-like AAA superfamily ATPase